MKRTIGVVYTILDSSSGLAPYSEELEGEPEKTSEYDFQATTG
jgi:hypothetical protein